MLLGVNIDHAATIRNARGTAYPDIIEIANIVKNSGANGLTAHLREDRRHIKDFDIVNLSKIDGLKLNLEMAATSEMQKIALNISPYACCIVPEKRMELTTEGGLNVAGQREKMIAFTGPLLQKGINVSLFIDPDFDQVQTSADIGVKFIELHTGAYAEAFGTEREEYEFQKLKKAADFAHSLNLTVNAGHGLNYENVHRMHEINNIRELNIGHSIIAHALIVGLDNAVKEMIEIVK